jgi:hypothetical protein
VAEDVEKINPDLVARDKEGKRYSVRYDQVNAMLLNEFLKGHKTLQEQGAIFARQQKQIEALTAGLQKVNAQLELTKPAPQTVSNDQRNCRATIFESPRAGAFRSRCQAHLNANQSAGFRFVSIGRLVGVICFCYFRIG